jgi:tetratricopeptide (TPR) repeat protein
VEQDALGARLERGRLDHVVANPGDLGAKPGFFALAAGAEWRAASMALTAVQLDAEPSGQMLLLWSAVCASVATNRAAIDDLKNHLGTADEALILEPLLRGLAVTMQMDELRRAVDAVADRGNIAPWARERLFADALLDANDNRAESWFNVGVARRRLGDWDGATAAFAQALELNPLFDVARDERDQAS